jgi:hypothetical protein
MIPSSLGGEPILMDGRNVGELTSTGYSLAGGPWRWLRARRHVLTDETCLARYRIDIAGELRAGRRTKPREGIPKAIAGTGATVPRPSPRPSRPCLHTATELAATAEVCTA